MQKSFRFNKVEVWALVLALTIFMGPALASAAPWKFGVMSDTQWPTSPDSKNPNVAVNVARHLNQEFINKGVKFVIQVGDLTDTGGTNNINLDVRATFAQDLYNAGIGFYPLRGNHENTASNAVRFQQIFPQTGAISANACTNNNHITSPDYLVGTTMYGPQANTNGTFCIGSNFASESTMEGLTYSFDVENARFVLIDQFTKPAGTAKSNLDATDVTWIGSQFSSRPANTHGFSFAHKGLVTENHADNMFNSTNPTNSQASKDLMESFMQNLATAGVRYHMGGHDHMHNRAIISSPNTGSYKVQNLIAASDSYKFYIPPVQATFNGQSAFRNLETPIAQELFTVGYYIFTVDGSKVTVDYYAMPNGCGGDCDQTYDVIPYAGNTPTNYNSPWVGLVTFANPVPFTKHDTFGYSLNGKEVLVAQSGSYALTDDTTKAIANGETGYKGTTAAILSGTNGSTGKDYNLRALTKSVNTGWAPATAGLASDIFTLWGMQDSLATSLTPQAAAPTYNNYTYVDPDTTKTDTFTLSVSYDATGLTTEQLQSGLFGLATKDAAGNWVNALNKNVGGTPNFVYGSWNASYGLGTYGVDTATKTAWAVINHNSDFAVTSLVGTQNTGFVYSRATKLYTGTLTITNNSPTALAGVALSNLTAGVTLNNASGTHNGDPSISFSLAPGASIGIPLQFSNPSNTKINFTAVTF